MKKSLLLSIGTLFSLLLTACSGADDCGCTKEKGEKEDEVSLEKDKGENYAFDTTSTNKDGSMSYEIFVRSFYDHNGDGIGDLLGVKDKIPYLADLGIKTIWLTPIHPSPSYHGYDVKDYCAVHEDFGTLADFDALEKEAAKYNIDIMLDMVFNHSSKQHPWFEQSYQDYKAKKTGATSKADWYNWSTTKGHVYKDLRYEGGFSSEMPDLNIKSDTLKAEIEKITKFWIEHGVDGFRLDAALHYVSNGTKTNVEFLTWLEETAHKYDKNFYMVGEVWADASTIIKYHESKCDSFFSFQSSFQPSATDVAYLGNVVFASSSMANVGKGNKWATQVENYEAAIKENNPDGYSSYFITNHDGDRASKYVSGCQAKALASLYCLLPGTPFMYYGEEIELKGERITSPDDQTDARRRLPMVWSKDNSAGKCNFPEPSRKELDNNEQVELGADDQLAKGWSLLNHYKKVINVRNKYPFFKKGVFKNATNQLQSDSQFVIAYKISSGSDSVTVVHNFNQYAVEVTAPGTEILDEINTNQQKPRIKDGKLGIGAYSTVIVK